MEDRSGQIDHGSVVFVWQQVADDLAAQMDDGTLPPGTRLPSHMDLADSVYRVAPDTIRRAVAELVERGRLEVAHGRGTFVARRH